MKGWRGLVCWDGLLGGGGGAAEKYQRRLLCAARERGHG